MITYLPDAAQAVGLLALLWLLHRWDRHMAHLAGQLKCAGGRDLWKVRCAHCRRPLRDGNTISRTVTHHYPAGGTATTTRTWHYDKPACAAAAIAGEDATEAGR